jgi:4-hydroxybenzoate polyprenyltransferase
LTLAYTFVLKKRVLVDCISLGALYTLRIVAGWSAVGLPPAFWLLTFSLFIFLSLAFLKRFTELRELFLLNRTSMQGRGYIASDLGLVQSMGIASGFASVLLLALYINGDTVSNIYSSPQVLWVLIPIHLYWVSRMWMKGERGEMHDDPVLFAVRDRYSLLCGFMFAAMLLIAR